MVAVTALVALIFMVISVRSRPGFALSMVVVSTLIWPEYLRFPLGLVQMSAPRMIVVALLIKYLFVRGGRKYPLAAIDKVVLILFVWGIFSKYMAGANFDVIKSSIGQALDTVVMFFAARLCLQTKSDLKDFAIPVMVCGAYMGLMGILEAVTSSSPYHFLFRYHQWNWVDKAPEYRLGLLRAKTSTSHYIYSGVSLLLVFGFAFALRKVAGIRRSRVKFVWLALGLCGLGVFSSLSSGPMSGLMCFLAFSFLYYKKALIRPLIGIVLLTCIIIEVASNRHFYNLVDYIALNSNTAWYRTKLIEVAVGQVHEYALFGLGGTPPDHWGKLIDGRHHVDIVNNFIFVAYSSGILGLILFVSIQIMSIRQAIRIQKYGDPALSYYGFCIVALILALMITSMSVGIFGPVLILSFLLYGATFIKPDSTDVQPRTKRVRAKPMLIS